MSNTYLAFNNLAVGSGLSGGSWNSSYPLHNLFGYFLSQKTVSANASASSTKFYVDVGDQLPFNFLGLIRTNLSANSSYRISASNDVMSKPAAPPVLIYDSGVVNLGGDIWHIFPVVTARYIKVELFDTSNPDGVIKMSRLFISNAANFSSGISKDAELSYISKTTTQESFSGVEFFDVKPLRRIYSFSVPYLTNNEAYNLAMELESISGTHKELVIIPDATDSIFAQKRNFLCRLAQLSPLKNPYIGMHQKAFEVLEII